MKRWQSWMRLVIALLLIVIASAITMQASSYYDHVSDGAEGYNELSTDAPGWVGNEWLVTLPLLALATVALYRRGHGGKLATLIILVMLGAENFHGIDGLRQAIAICLYLLFVIGLTVNLAFSQDRAPIKM